MEQVLSGVREGSLDEAGQIALKQYYTTLLVKQQRSAGAFAGAPAKGTTSAVGPGQCPVGQKVPPSQSVLAQAVKPSAQHVSATKQPSRASTPSTVIAKTLSTGKGKVPSKEEARQPKSAPPLTFFLKSSTTPSAPAGITKKSVACPKKTASTTSAPKSSSASSPMDLTVETPAVETPPATSQLKRAHTAESLSSSDKAVDINDNGDFETAVNRKTKKARRTAYDPVSGEEVVLEEGAVVGRARADKKIIRPKPLVLEGMDKEIIKNPLSVKQLFTSQSGSIFKTVTTKAGTLLVFAKDEESRQCLTSIALPEGVTLRNTKPRVSSGDSLCVIIVGVDPSVSDEELITELGRPCRRIRSARQEGMATWKVKMTCETLSTKNNLMSRGISIGHQRHRVVGYEAKQSALQCYNCQGFNHRAKVCKAEVRCQKCGEDHVKKDCQAEAPHCTNCKGDHLASDFRCPQFVQETTKKASATLSYASAVKKNGDKVDCTRLACSMAGALVKILSKRLGLQVSSADIYNDVVGNIAKFFKCDITGEQIHGISIQQ